MTAEQQLEMRKSFRSMQEAKDYIKYNRIRKGNVKGDHPFVFVFIGELPYDGRYLTNKDHQDKGYRNSNYSGDMAFYRWEK